MKYSKLVKTYEKLENTQSTLEKTSILAEFFKEVEKPEQVVLLSMGRIFPAWKDLDLGISSRTLVDIIVQATGRTEKEVEEAWKQEGDLGSAAEEMMKKKTQQRLMTQKLTVERVIEKLEKVATMENDGLDRSVNMDKKKKHVAELVSSANPQESRYLTRTIIENMRLGVGEGIIRDALAEAFFNGEHTEDIQRAYDLTNDFTEVTEACEEGIEKVRSLEMEIFKPINSMLAKKVETIEEGFESVGKPALIDIKFDGMRAQIHVKDGEVKIFTRRLEDVTKQFPDVVEKVRNHVKAENCILDTEIVGYKPEDGSMIPFQKLSKRIKRKYEIERLRKEIPVEVRPFDLIYKDKSLLKTSYNERLERLESIIDEEKHELRLVDKEITEKKQKVQEMQQNSLNEGHEGIMMKALEAEYKPGSRVGYMVKLKPVMETLDLAIIGAKWGEGRRSGWLSRLKLGCYSPENNEYLEVGKMATGLTDEQLEEITQKLKPLVVEENGRDVKVKPEVIVEAEYEEIQKSPTYNSGYALRFPRMKQFREDKEQADEIKKVEDLYKSQ